MVKSAQRYERKIIITLLLFMLVVGALCVRSYGIPWDEWEEIKTLASNLKSYAGLFGGEENSLVQKIEDKGIVAIEVNENRDHGEAVYYPIFPLLMANGNSLRHVMLTWHYYTYLIFVAGIVFLYCIVKRLFGDWRLGIVAGAGAFAYLSPRFFAEGFY